MNPVLWLLFAAGGVAVVAGVVISQQAQSAAPSPTNPPVPAGTPAPAASSTPAGPVPVVQPPAATSTYPNVAPLKTGPGAVTTLSTTPTGSTVATFDGTFGSVTGTAGNASNAPTATPVNGGINFQANGSGSFSFVVNWTDSTGAAQVTTVIVVAESTLQPGA